jgi:hypothetical protein
LTSPKKEEFIHSSGFLIFLTEYPFHPRVFFSLLPVVEITERSIVRGDLTTTRNALDRIMELQSELKADVDGPVLDRYLADHLTRIGRKAVNRPDEEEAAVRAIEALERTGVDGAPLIAAERIDLLGFIALRHGSDGAVEQMIRSLAVIASAQNNAALDSVLDSYQALVGRLASGGFDQLLIHLADRADSLADLGTGESAAIGRCLDCIESIGHDAADNRLIRVVLHMTRLLRDRGMKIALTSQDEANATVLRMLRIEQAVDKSEREALAVIGFARSEVEQAARDATAATTATDTSTTNESVDSDDGFSDLWNEDNN